MTQLHEQIAATIDNLRRASRATKGGTKETAVVNGHILVVQSSLAYSQGGQRFTLRTTFLVDNQRTAERHVFDALAKQR